MNSRLKKKKAPTFDQLFFEANIYKNMFRIQDSPGSILGYSHSILADTSESI
jgi:hypothetical protein